MSAPVDVTYRAADLSDHPIVVELMRELVVELGQGRDQTEVLSLLDDDIRVALESERVTIVLAAHDDLVIGLGRGDILTRDPIFRLRRDHRCGYVDQMYVRRPYRGHRIGAALLRKLEQWFRDQGVNHCLLHAAPKAVRFYARKGYQPNREMFKRL